MSAPKAEAAGLTVERREELRRLAEAATPGPWERLFSDVHRRDADYCVANGDGGATAAHIAAFDPPTVVALLDALAVAEATCDAYRDEYRATCDLLREANDAHDAMGAERDEARAAVERVRALADELERRARLVSRKVGGDTRLAQFVHSRQIRAALDTASSEGA